MLVLHIVKSLGNADMLVLHIFKVHALPYMLAFHGLYLINWIYQHITQFVPSERNLHYHKIWL